MEFYLFLIKYEYDFLEAKITQQTSPEEAYRKFEELGVKQIDSLRKLTKEVILKKKIKLKYEFLLLLIIKGTRNS